MSQAISSSAAVIPLVFTKGLPFGYAYTDADSFIASVLLTVCRWDKNTNLAWVLDEVKAGDRLVVRSATNTNAWARFGVTSVLVSASHYQFGILTDYQGDIIESGDEIQIEILKGGSGGSATEVEIDFGSSPVFDKTFTVTEATATLASKIIAVESGSPASGRGSGDSLFDAITLTASPGSGQFTLYAKANPGPVIGKRKIIYQVI